MKVLYSTMSVVEYDGHNYYSNPIQATYPRYLALGEDITVMCYQKKVEKAKSDKIDTSNLRFVFIDKVSSIKDFFSKRLRKNERVIEEEVKRADICVIHLTCPHSYRVIKYARLYNKPYMNVICVCTWDEYWNYDWRGKIIAPFEFMKLRKAQANAKYSIYVTNKFLQHRYPTKGYSIGCSNVNIHTGVDGILEKRKEQIIQRSNENSILKIATLAAVDVPYKGQKYVIEALAKLKSLGFIFEYHLIGGGNDFALKHISEKKGVAKQVFFHGAIPHSEVLTLLDGIDIYIQPSKQEGLPRALIEAMSRGCLCLGSKTAGIPELLDKEYVFPKGGVKKIVEILRGISVCDLLSQAERNFNEAKEYDVNVLNERRSRFINTFKNSLANNNLNK